MLTVESEKLQVPIFQPSVNVDPLQTFYMRQTSDSYNASGFSFYLKSPSMHALLDPEIWIRYRVKVNSVTAVGADSLLALTMAGLANAGAAAGLPFSPGGATAAYAAVPDAVAHFAFRQGNVMQRCMQSLVVVINGFSLTCEPWKFIDPLNRLYVSENQSKHIFSTSGGQYDSGNFGLVTDRDVYATGACSGGAAVGSVFHMLQRNVAAGAAAVDNYRYSFPLTERWYNPGFSDRCDKFTRECRGEIRSGDLATSRSLPNGAVGIQGQFSAQGSGNGAGGGGAVNQGGGGNFLFDIYERLPISPFKMYHNDGVGGVIPNIKDLIIRGGFTANLNGVMMQGNAVHDTFFNILLGSEAADCEIFLKWYSPPNGVMIPREISIPMRKIDVWSNSKTIIAVGAAEIKSASYQLSEYNIALDAVPDLLLIYVRKRLDDATVKMPSDYHYELQNLQISLENHGGKMTQIQTIELYQKWLKYSMHGDFQEVCYDEWRKYLCIAVLKPEDYGIINGPGYDNPIILGIQANVYSYYNNPAIGLKAAELFDQTTAELVVVSIYDKWSLMISANGIARAELTRIRTSAGTISTAASLQSINGSGGANGGLPGLMQ